MPLHNKRPFTPTPTPTCAPTDEVFQLWPTGEVFPTYPAYIAALWEQRTPVWTCSVTARGGLTLPEALASESAALGSLEDMPEAWKAVSARTIHHSLHALNHCATAVFERAKAGELLEGEEVSLVLNGERLFGRILSITKSLDAGAERVRLALYRDAECRTDSVGESTVVGMVALTRAGRAKTVTKSLIKRYMRSIARRDNPFAPWVVERRVAEHFGLPLEIPAELTQPKPTAGKASKKRKSEGAGVQAEAVAELRYPIEDLLVPPQDMTVLDDDAFTPVSQEYGASRTEFVNALVIWSFLNSFSRTLHLSPFSFDDWMAALTAHSTCHLLDEAFGSLFEPICKQRRSQSRAQFAAYLQQAGVAKHLGSTVETNVAGQAASSKKQSKWFESGKSLGLLAHCIGLVEEALEVADECGMELPGWSPLLGSLKQVKKGALPSISDLLFIFNLLTALFVDKHSQQLKEAVDAEIDKAEGLRDKVKDIQTEEQDLAEEIKAMELDSLDDGPKYLRSDSKERRRVESALKKAKQSATVLERKREATERDIRKASCAHRKERLGQDRHHRTYWWMDGWRAAGSASGACGKLFIEDCEGGWSFIDCQQDLDRLIACLNDKGIRESRLKKALVQYRDHMYVCFIPSTCKQKSESEVVDQRRRGGVKKQEPSYLRYKNKFS